MKNMFFARLLSSLTLFSLIGLPASSAALNLELPDIDLSAPATGSPTGAAAADSEAGLKMVREMRRQLPVIDDPELTGWVQSLGNRLARRSSNTGRLYFLLVNDPDVNAFATLGGVIVINSGLVLYTESESELAAVIAHEIAHVSQNHISRMIAQSKTNVLGTGAALLAGVAASSQSPEAANAIVTTAMAMQQHQQLSFSRDMESEADRVGIKILSSAGFRASGMPQFMEKLDALNDSPYAQLTKYLQTHPLSLERVGDTRSLAARLGKGGKEDPDYLYVREKIRALSAVGGLAQMPALQNPQLKIYAEAMQLAKRGATDAALQQLGGINPNSVPQALAKADLLMKKRRYKEVITLLEPLLAKTPGEQAILILYCNALLATGRVDEAWTRIRGVVADEMDSLSFFETRQEIATAKGYIADAYLAAAERNIRIGEYTHAMAQLRQASRLPNISANDVARLQSRLNLLELSYGRE